MRMCGFGSMSGGYRIVYCSILLKRAWQQIMIPLTRGEKNKISYTTVATRSEAMPLYHLIWSHIIMYWKYKSDSTEANNSTDKGRKNTEFSATADKRTWHCVNVVEWRCNARDKDRLNRNPNLVPSAHSYLCALLVASLYTFTLNFAGSDLRKGQNKTKNKLKDEIKKSIPQLPHTFSESQDNLNAHFPSKIGIAIYMMDYLPLSRDSLFSIPKILLNREYIYL
ncbi:hypothetical protein VNO77_11266 [Canavalia gladiata]|uniref:Uncharacterized protein n=1 Tax=Canavalia gladiata TaxID=3824 RepID=A0AAN9QY57_CANGL